jgi:hypothetical protein
MQMKQNSLRHPIHRNRSGDIEGLNVDSSLHNTGFDLVWKTRRSNGADLGIQNHHGSIWGVGGRRKKRQGKGLLRERAQIVLPVEIFKDVNPSRKAYLTEGDLHKLS